MPERHFGSGTGDTQGDKEEEPDHLNLTGHDFEFLFIDLVLNGIGL
jgi:hypothetical protein